MSREICRESESTILCDRPRSSVSAPRCRSRREATCSSVQGGGLASSGKERAYGSASRKRGSGATAWQTTLINCTTCFARQFSSPGCDVRLHTEHPDSRKIAHQHPHSQPPRRDPHSEHQGAVPDDAIENSVCRGALPPQLPELVHRHAKEQGCRSSDESVHNVHREHALEKRVDGILAHVQSRTSCEVEPYIPGRDRIPRESGCKASRLESQEWRRGDGVRC